MAPFLPLITAVLAAIGPLTPEQQQLLQTAVDGSDHREPAFAALLEHAQSWTPGPGDTAIRLEPDLDAMITDPHPHRGSLCRIAGRIEQCTPLDPPYDAAAECFIRDQADRPVLVYVLASPNDDVCRPGRHVEVFARFYKRVDAVARDGRFHRYAAFVGARPRPIAPGVDRAADVMRMWIIVALVAALLVVFILVFTVSRRGGRDPRPHRPARPEAHLAALDGEPPLPDDPAAALAELHRRVERGS